VGVIMRRLFVALSSAVCVGSRSTDNLQGCIAATSADIYLDWVLSRRARRMGLDIKQHRHFDLHRRDFGR
jgi:hypothetical protein